MASQRARWRLKWPASRLFIQPFVQQIKENTKAPLHWPLWGEFTGHRWIPRTKGQYRGKCFHLMTSSCITSFWWMSATYQFHSIDNASIHRHIHLTYIMTSSNGNIFRVTGPLCGEFIGQPWIPRTKASDAEHWCFLWYASEWTAD